MVVKRARPEFQISQYADGTPFIVIEYFDGAELRRQIALDLPHGTSAEQALAARDYLSRNIIAITEA
jgi:hypothetical protein